MVGIGRLAALCGVERRTLERLFRDSVGFSPKRLCRIVRFQRVLREVRLRPQAWVDIAVRCGYFDQAHLIRDFRELSGDSPAVFLRDEPALSRCFTSPERLSRFFAS